jgi:hypothetical protein
MLGYVTPSGREGYTLRMQDATSKRAADILVFLGKSTSIEAEPLSDVEEIPEQYLTPERALSNMEVALASTFEGEASGQ